MKKVCLTNDSGGWFDSEKARCYEERTYWDGSNHISCNSGSQWEHEALHRTCSGRWVLNRWSQYQGTAETYEEVSAREAAAWLNRNDLAIPQELVRYVEGLEI